MNLDKRLLACAEFVSGKNKAVDVGTDHGYLASYLILEGIASSVIACDVNEKPLASACETVEKLNIKENVDIVLSDGLLQIKQENVSDVIIAGMGGELISRIISQSNWNFENVNLILQPMTKISFLRKFLYENGFEIVTENVVEEQFFYVIMQVKFTGFKKKYSEYDEILGKIFAVNNTKYEYLIFLYNKYKKVRDGLKKSDAKDLGKLEDTEKLLLEIKNRLEEKYDS